MKYKLLKNGNWIYNINKDIKILSDFSSSSSVSFPKFSSYLSFSSFSNSNNCNAPILVNRIYIYNFFFA